MSNVELSLCDKHYKRQCTNFKIELPYCQYLAFCACLYPGNEIFKFSSLAWEEKAGRESAANRDFCAYIDSENRYIICTQNKRKNAQIGRQFETTKDES